MLILKPLIRCIAAAVWLLVIFPAESAPKPVAAKAPVATPCVYRAVPSAASAGAAYFQDCSEAPDMLWLRGGNFVMGDRLANGVTYDQPAHKVQVGSFAISRTEVTNAQWQACVRAGACQAPTLEPAFAAPAQPVVNVSWSDPKAYVGWLSKRTGKTYRLPTEAEWEYAARAGNEDQYTWGNNTEFACHFANVLDISGRAAQPLWTWNIDCDDGFGTTAPVGSFPANRWGLHDMLGNVWEWVQDCWHGDYNGAPATSVEWVGGGDCEKRVNRGGGWGNHPRTLRVSNRDGDPPESRSDGLGFRVARDMPPVAN